MAENNGTIDPNTGMGNGGVAGFLTSLLGGLQAQNQNRQQMQANQANLDAFKSQQAKTQYDANVNVARERRDLLTNPQFIKRQQDLAKAAGLPDPMQMSSAVTGATNDRPADTGAGSQINIQPGAPVQPGAAPGGNQPQMQLISPAQRTAASQQLAQIATAVKADPSKQTPELAKHVQALQQIVAAPQQQQPQQSSQGGQQQPQGGQQPGQPGGAPAQPQQPQVSPAQAQAAQTQLTQVYAALEKPGQETNPALIARARALQQIVDTSAQQKQQSTLQNATRQSGNGTVAGQPGTVQQPGTPAIGGAFQSSNFGQVGMPRETLDINSMAPRPDLHSPDMEKQNEYAGTLPPGAIRDRFLQGFSGVSQADREAPAIATQQDKTQVGKDFMTIMTNVGKGVVKGPMAIAQIRSIVPRAMAAGYDPEDLITALQDDAEVGPATQASMDKARSAGMSDKALAAYHTMLTVDKPKWMADQIRQAEQKIDISAENAQTNRMNAGSRAISANAAATSAAARASNAQVTADNAVARTTALTKTADARMMDAQTHVKANNLAQARADIVSLNVLRSSLNTEYNTISRQVDTMIANQKNPNEAGPDIPDPANPGQTIPGPSLLDKQKAVKDKLDELTGVIGTTKAAITAGPTTAVRNSMGNGSAVIGKQPMKSTSKSGKPIFSDDAGKTWHY
jgi:hypothetical protein